MPSVHTCVVSSDAAPPSRISGVFSPAIEPLPQTLWKLRGARWRHPDRVPFAPALGPLEHERADMQFHRARRAQLGGTERVPLTMARVGGPGTRQARWT